MIECVDERIWYIKKKKIKNGRNFRKKFKKILIVFLILFATIFYLINVNKKVSESATEKIREVAINSVNDAVLTSITVINYNDLIVFERDTSGQVSLISVNSLISNEINRSVAQSAKTKIDNYLKNGVPIPVGTFSGIGFLSGKGKNVYLKVYNVESVICTFKSKFEDAGINQTLHSLYLSVEVTASLMFNGKDKYIKTSSEVLLAENLIVGKIPDIYLNSSKN